MSNQAAVPPKYDVSLVAQVILEVAVELHPQRLKPRDLALRVIGDPEDGREMKTAASAISSLRQWGLFSYKNDVEVVEPTRAALRAVSLLAG